jgi:Anti-repressor SinI
MEANKVDDNNGNSHRVDYEWVRLLAEAKALGIIKEEIREFLQINKSEVETIIE